MSASVPHPRRRGRSAPISRPVARAVPVCLAAVVVATIGGCGASDTASPLPDPAPSVASPSQAAARPTTDGGDRPNILLIVPDSLSGDRVGAVHDGHPVTPALDALAARGVRFSNMYSQAGWTLPALASLLSGRWSLVPDGNDSTPLAFLRADRQTVPELFAAAGYRTAVFWGPGMANAAPEFSRGFQTVVREAEGDAFDAGLLAWLREDDHTPFFALVHNVDLQFPVVTVPGHPLLSTLPPSAGMGMEPMFMELDQRGGRQQAAAAMDTAYDAVITRYDAAIGRMVAGLDDLGLRDHTVVVVTSNHGLDMGTHGHYFHGTLYDTNLHVPLVVSDPRLPDSGRQVDTVVQTLDLAPTLLARAGLDVPADLPGASLAPLLGGGGTYTPRDVYSLTSTTGMSIRTDRYKVAHVAEKGAAAGTGRLQVFDLQADPQEQRELAPPYPDGVDALVAKLDAWSAERLEETERIHRGGVQDDAALKKALQEDGYWGVVKGDPEGTGGKATKPAAAGKGKSEEMPGAPGTPPGGPLGPPGVHPPPPPGGAPAGRAAPAR